MKEKYIIEAFDKIHTSDEDMIDKVRRGLADKKKVRRVSGLRVAACACVAFGLIAAVTLNGPSIVTFAQETIRTWIGTVKGSGEEVDTTGTYNKLNNTEASRSNAKYSTLSEIDDLLGIRLLKSSMAYEDADNLVQYNPYVEKGNLNGATVIDRQYAVGDISIKNIHNAKEWNTVPQMEFTPGTKYKSTLYCQITIRSDQVPEDTDGNKELNYTGSTRDLPEGTKLEKYELGKLRTTAAIFEQNLAGNPMDSLSIPAGADNEDAVMPATTASVTYDGVEYLYSARVSFDTMKAFLDTLS